MQLQLTASTIRTQFPVLLRINWVKTAIKNGKEVALTTEQPAI